MSLTRGLERAAFLALFILLTLLLCHSWYGPDIWYHLTWGRDLWQGSSWLPEQHTLLRQPVLSNPYWLFQSLIHFAYGSGGLYLASAVFGLVWWTAAFVWLRLIRAFDQPLWGVALAFCALLIVQLRFEQRPEVFSYLFLVLTLGWITNPIANASQRRDLGTLFVIQLLWSNFHIYFALGPLLMAAYALSTWTGQNKSERRRAAWALLVTVTASFCTPFGWNNWQLIAAYAQVGGELRDINAELFPPSLWPMPWPLPLFWLLWCAVALLIASHVWRRKVDFAVWSASAGLLLSAQATRNMPMLVLLSAPLLARWPRSQVKPVAASLGASAALIAALALSLQVVRGEFHRATGSLGSFGIQLEPSAYPRLATEFLRDMNFRGRLFADSYDGGYLEFHLPAIQVAGDSFFSDPQLTRTYFAAIREPTALAQLSAQLKFDAFLINVENFAVLDALLSDPHWQLRHVESHRALFLPAALKATHELENSATAARATFYHGEDLRNWNNAFGPRSWAAMARRRQWPEVMRKILADVQGAPHIPSNLLKIAMSEALRSKDRDLARAGVELSARSYEMELGQNSEVRQLADQLRSCCL